MTTPYEADPTKIPPSDLYADIPFYGRYLPQPSDNTGRQLSASAPKTSGSTPPTNAAATHLHARENTSTPFQAIALAETVLEVKVPDIYFAGKINGRQVLIQERTRCVGLSVAIPYLSQAQRESFKPGRSCGNCTPGISSRTHIVPDPNILTNGRLNPLEVAILFSDADADADADKSCMHNDLTESNCIVDNDQIVGLVDWEMAGFLGWKVAGDVHRRIGTPQREHFVNAGLSEEQLGDLLFWGDLYDEGMPTV
ncbi:hypothetical protein BDW62DRAFT_207364 [Aspergillus aurantiobrunneus]